jgi:imidazole glycerol-phosphate synthase subunit HisH
LSASNVVIIANGGANIASLQFALQRLGTPSAVTANARKIRGASHVILPGVGAAGDAMSRLRQMNLDTLIPALQQPVLGICLGMQLLFDASEEGAA